MGPSIKSPSMKGGKKVEISASKSPYPVLKEQKRKKALPYVLVIIVIIGILYMTWRLL